MTFSLELRLTRNSHDDVGPPLCTDLAWPIDLLDEPARIEARLHEIVRDMDRLGILPPPGHDNDNGDDQTTSRF